MVVYIPVRHLPLARWLSWLECRPVTAEVVGSNPIEVAIGEKPDEKHCKE